MLSLRSRSHACLFKRLNSNNSNPIPNLTREIAKSVGLKASADAKKTAGWGAFVFVAGLGLLGGGLVFSIVQRGYCNPIVYVSGDKQLPKKAPDHITSEEDIKLLNLLKQGLPDGLAWLKAHNIPNLIHTERNFN